MRRRSAARRRLPSSRTTKNKRSFSSIIEIVMHILHHCNHEPALSARIEKTYLGNVDNKMKTRLSKSPEDAAKQFSLVLPRYKSYFHNTAWVDFRFGPTGLDPGNIYPSSSNSIFRPLRNPIPGFLL